MGKIRLACLYCDRNDFDSVDEIPSDWFEVDEVQTYEESCQQATPTDPKVSVFDWYTHLGVCPECHQAETLPKELSA